MAIQIWKDGQYKSVDLAQYGADGALSGAYVWRDGAWRTLWEKASSLPVVQITATAPGAAQSQFKQACIDYGTTYDTVETLPFQLDTSQATNLSSMFQDCSSLTQVPDLDTSQVTSMDAMFLFCAALTRAPNLDTSQVTSMNAMFRGCSSLTQVPDLDTSQVTSMIGIFLGCSSLTQVPDLDTAQTTNMSSMFEGCAALTDGNVRLIGKHPSVNTRRMLTGSGLTREPFYDTNGDPI